MSNNNDQKQDNRHVPEAPETSQAHSDNQNISTRANDNNLDQAGEDWDADDFLSIDNSSRRTTLNGSGFDDPAGDENTPVVGARKGSGAEAKTPSDSLTEDKNNPMLGSRNESSVVTKTPPDSPAEEENSPVVGARKGSSVDTKASSGAPAEDENSPVVGARKGSGADTKTSPNTPSEDENSPVVGARKGSSVETKTPPDSPVVDARKGSSVDTKTPPDSPAEDENSSVMGARKGSGADTKTSFGSPADDKNNPMLGAGERYGEDSKKSPNTPAEGENSPVVRARNGSDVGTNTARINPTETEKVSKLDDESGSSAREKAASINEENDENPSSSSIRKVPDNVNGAIPQYVNQPTSNQEEESVSDNNLQSTFDRNDSRTSSAALRSDLGQSTRASVYQPDDRYSSTRNEAEPQRGVSALVNDEVEPSISDEGDRLLTDEAGSTIVAIPSENPMKPSLAGKKGSKATSGSDGKGLLASRESQMVAVFAGIVFIMSLIQVVIGSLYKNNCPINPYIPLYLIVAGILGLALPVLLFSLRLVATKSKYPADAYLFEYLLFLIYIASFLIGCVWMFGVYSPVQLVDPTKTYTYCLSTVFYCGLITVIASGIFVLLLLFISYRIKSSKSVKPASKKSSA